MTLREAWEAHAHRWIGWARAPGHDSYWRFHRDAFLPLVPPPGRLTVDIGCGEGRVGRDLAALGHRVVAVDVSTTMLAAAASPPTAGRRAVTAAVAGDAAALPLAARSADCAVAFMSFQDVDEPVGAIAEAARVLSPGGRLVMAIVHPLNSAGRFVGEHGDPSRPFVIDGSWFERRYRTDEADRDGLTMTFTSEHRPLDDYTEALAGAGFLLERLREVADPDPSSAWHRVPLFLHVRAVLPEGAGGR